MKKFLLLVLCVLFVLSLSACTEKEVSNETPSVENSGYSDSTYDESDDRLMDIQDIIGFWIPSEIYQAPRVTDGEYDSDEAALNAAQSNPVQISMDEFVSPLFYTDCAVYEKVTVQLSSLSDYGIQVDDVLEGLAADGSVIRVDIFDGEDDSPAFQVFILDNTTMLYEGDSGYIFLANLEESVG